MLNTGIYLALSSDRRSSVVGSQHQVKHNAWNQGRLVIFIIQITNICIFLHLERWLIMNYNNIINVIKNFVFKLQ